MAAIEAKAGRPESAGCDDAAEAISLVIARKLFSRLAQALDGEIERLARLIDTDPEESRIKDVSNLIRDTQRALLTVLDFQSRLGGRDSGEVDGALDLDAARDEIIGRIARLAQRGGAGGVS